MTQVYCGGISKKEEIRKFYLVDQGISTDFGLGTISLAKEPTRTTAAEISFFLSEISRHSELHAVYFWWYSGGQGLVQC